MGKQIMFLTLGLAVCCSGCKKLGLSKDETATDTAASTPPMEAVPEPPEPTPKKRVIDFKARVNKVMDEGAAEREKRVREIFE
jgi:hypothetical protein